MYEHAKRLKRSNDINVFTRRINEIQKERQSPRNKLNSSNLLLLFLLFICRRLVYASDWCVWIFFFSNFFFSNFFCSFVWFSKINQLYSTAFPTSTITYHLVVLFCSINVQQIIYLSTYDVRYRRAHTTKLRPPELRSIDQ